MSNADVHTDSYRDGIDKTGKAAAGSGNSMLDL